MEREERQDAPACDASVDNRTRFSVEEKGLHFLAGPALAGLWRAQGRMGEQGHVELDNL
jgi:hypothetical protein